MQAFLAGSAQRIGVVAAVAFAALSATGAATYDSWADGDRTEYAAAALLAVALGAFAWACVRLASPGRGVATVVSAWGAALVMLLPVGAVHFQRASHPLARTREHVIADAFESPSGPAPHTWIVQRQGNAAVEARSDSVALVAPPGGVAFLDLLLPGVPSAAQGEFWLPRGVYTHEYEESLEWRAAATLTGDFAIMLETRQLLVQVVPYGLHITYPNERRQVTQHHIEQPGIAGGAAHTYRLERVGGVIRLRVDDASGWVQPDAGRFGLVRFGQTRAEAQHAGTIVLGDVRYARRYTALPDAKSAERRPG